MPISDTFSGLVVLLVLAATVAGALWILRHAFPFGLEVAQLLWRFCRSRPWVPLSILFWSITTMFAQGKLARTGAYFPYFVAIIVSVIGVNALFMRLRKRY